METEQYIIRGGIEGRERLRILSRVMQPTTLDLLRRAGLKPGLSCLEIGCGGGDVACDMARIAGPTGRVLATDIDGPQLDIARREAEPQGLANIEFIRSDITREIPAGPFDFIHARFVLTHIPNPGEALAWIKSVLNPGGMIALEEIDFSGHFCHPDCPALWRYVELYTETVKRRGGDANIGPRLPGLALAAGFSNVGMNVVQRAGHEGEVKLITPITMQNIAPAVLRAGLANEAEINAIVQELYDYAQTPGTIGCLARVFEVWATA
ncbi:MAG: methyltransferase domain-containing protein [Proteobacteria bacterium]|nr:methyltransferase domain-containing protein [Pseudomonadota bacterium]